MCLKKLSEKWSERNLEDLGKEIEGFEKDFENWLLNDPAGINWHCNCKTCQLGREIAVNDARQLNLNEYQVGENIE